MTSETSAHGGYREEGGGVCCAAPAQGERLLLLHWCAASLEVVVVEVGDDEGVAHGD
jgi:hypothetical protein